MPTTPNQPSPPDRSVSPSKGLAGSIRPWRHTAPPKPMPDRYSVRETKEGRYLCCVEAPELKVKIERELSVKGISARKYPEGSIFLDGAAQGEPFLDLERQVFNLDHHEGCVRNFTLATCEQAMVLTLRGLDLRERPWTVFANNPDLDTILAVWVLLNGMHLAKDPQVRQTVIPLIRLEGVIDAHGLELKEFSGLPPRLLEETSTKLESLMESELAVKTAGQWDQTDFLEYTATQLRRIDTMVYPAGYFEGLRSVEELGRVELTNQRIAVICRSDAGIYELEADLKKLYGKRLGVIVLEKDPKTFTLRQVDPFLPADLNAVYSRLNVLDPAVTRGDSENRWGGSAEIGGSPRGPGTRLKPDEIAEACRQAFRRPTLVQRIGAVLLSALISGLVPGVAVAATLATGLAVSVLPSAAGQLRFLGIGLGLGLLALVVFARKRPRLFGLRFPGGWDWILMIPPALAGGIAGGTWATAWPAGNARLILLLGLPVVAEFTFRGLAHGILIREFPIQHSGGRWFLSWPVVFSALLYTAWSVSLNLQAIVSAPPFLPVEGTPWILPGAVALFGLAAGTARERSGSIVAPLLLHYLSLAALLSFSP